MVYGIEPGENDVRSLSHPHHGYVPRNTRAQAEIGGTRTANSTLLGFGFNPMYVFDTPASGSPAVRPFVQGHVGYWFSEVETSRLNLWTATRPQRYRKT